MSIFLHDTRIINAFKLLFSEKFNLFNRLGNSNIRKQLDMCLNPINYHYLFVDDDDDLQHYKLDEHEKISGFIPYMNTFKSWDYYYDTDEVDFNLYYICPFTTTFISHDINHSEILMNPSIKHADVNFMSSALQLNKTITHLVINQYHSCLNLNNKPLQFLAIANNYVPPELEHNSQLKTLILCSDDGSDVHLSSKFNHISDVIVIGANVVRNCYIGNITDNNTFKSLSQYELKNLASLLLCDLRNTLYMTDFYRHKLLHQLIFIINDIKPLKTFNKMIGMVIRLNSGEWDSRIFRDDFSELYIDANPYSIHDYDKVKSNKFFQYLESYSFFNYEY